MEVEKGVERGVMKVVTGTKIGKEVEAGTEVLIGANVGAVVERRKSSSDELEEKALC